MFFSKHKKLAKMIDGFVKCWSSAQAMDCFLAKEDKPKIDRIYYAILYGGIDSLAQSIGVNADTTIRGLKYYLKDFSNSDEVFQKISETIHDPSLRKWIIDAGEAVRLIDNKTKAPTEALLPLAEKYRLAVNAE